MFDDGVRLRVYPVDLEDPIEIRACVLNDSNVISIATRDLFWSTGGKQVDLAAWLEAAVEAERQVYRAYRARRIEEAVWQEKFRLFWKVMIRSRNILGVLAVGALPSVDVLEDKGLLDLV